MVNAEVCSMIPGQGFRTRLAGQLADGGECYITTAGEPHFYPLYPPLPYEQIVASYGEVRARSPECMTAIALHPRRGT